MGVLHFGAAGKGRHASERGALCLPPTLLPETCRCSAMGHRCSCSSGWEAPQAVLALGDVSRDVCHFTFVYLCSCAAHVCVQAFLYPLGHACPTVRHVIGASCKRGMCFVVRSLCSCRHLHFSLHLEIVAIFGRFHFHDFLDCHKFMLEC